MFLSALVGLGWAAVQAAPLTLAIAESPLFATALVAEAEGFYAAEGLDLKIIHCVNGKRCLRHLLDGEAHFATVADTPIMLAALAGDRFDILGTLGTSSRENHFVARADRGIHKPADLRGKRIGVVKGTTGHYFADTVLLFNGVPNQQVTLVPLDAADSSAALIRGEVDAAALFSPNWQKAETALGKMLVTLPNPPIFTITVNLVGVSAAQGARDEDAVKLLRALKRADQLMDSHPARARAILAGRLKIALPDVEAMWGNYDFSITLQQPLIVALEAQSRWALREGMVPGARMPDYLDYIRPAPLKAVDARAVGIIK